MKFRRSRLLKQDDVHIDNTPMADTVFLLLIFFMISASFLIQSGISIKLPKTVSDNEQLKEELVLVIDSDEQMYLDNDKIDIKQLKLAISKKIRKVKDRQLVIKADKNVKHGFVVSVMDIAKNSGVDKLAIATEKKRDNEE